MGPLKIFHVARKERHWWRASERGSLAEKESVKMRCESQEESIFVEAVKKVRSNLTATKKATKPLKTSKIFEALLLRVASGTLGGGCPRIDGGHGGQRLPKTVQSLGRRS